MRNSAAMQYRQESPDRIRPFSDIIRYAEDNGIEYFNLVGNDWIFAGACNPKSRRYSGIGLGVLTALVLATLISGYFEGVLVNRRLNIDMVSDLGFWLIIAIDYLLGISLVFMFRNFTRLFICIIDQRRKELPYGPFNDFVSRVQPVISHRGWALLIYLLSAVIFVFQYTGMALTRSGTWHMPGGLSVSSLVFIPLNLLHQLLIMQLLVRSVQMSIVLVRFSLGRDTNIHSKRGFSRIVVVVGKFSLLNYILIFTLSCLLAFSLYNNTELFGFPVFHFYNIILIIEFILCSFVLFVTPILLLLKNSP